MTGFQNNQIDVSFSEYWCEIELLWNLHFMVWLKVEREETFYIQCWAVTRIECATRWKIGSLSYYKTPAFEGDRRSVIEDVSTGNRIYCAAFFIRPKFSVDKFIATGEWDPEWVYNSNCLE